MRSGARQHLGHEHHRHILFRVGEKIGRRRAAPGIFAHRAGQGGTGQIDRHGHAQAEADAAIAGFR